ncbi:MAG: PD-(D/E)XK nuclease family protein [Pseudomonadota bacterium]
MAEASGPNIYSIAAHRGFADALVAGLVPRYSDNEMGLARLTLLVPSSRAARTISEAFVRHSGKIGSAGLLMPRMVTVGDLDLDEALGALLDPLGAADIPPATEPTKRWLELAKLIEIERAAQGDHDMPAAARLRMARELGRTMDRLLVEEKTPEDLLSEPILDMLGDLSDHWKRSLRIFARVQERWRARLSEMGEVDPATRRNQLFGRSTQRWKADPPATPIVAAGVTSASPALARMLRAVADLPSGAVVLPDLDLSLSEEAWEELGKAGARTEAGGEIFGKNDVLTHPQYHLKLLLERMGIARAEVRPWHRSGMSAAEPARAVAISSLFLPPKASQSWVGLEPEKRRLKGVTLMTSVTAEEEAQSIATLVREALEVPERRIAVISADRTLARRVAQNLERWKIEADDTAGRALSLTPAGRLFGLLGDLVSHGLGPAHLIGALGHPLVLRDEPEARREWLASLRRFDRRLRGPSPAPGLGPLRDIARKAGVAEWWEGAEQIVERLYELPPEIGLADALDLLSEAGEALAGEALWSREDGRALSAMVDDVRLHARLTGTVITPSDLAGILRDMMDEIAVRPPYGGHPRVAIYGLLESRLARADLIICAGLNEGSWPQAPGSDSLLAPGVLRALGVPGAEFRIGLAAHDLAGALGAPEVVLSRAQRDAEGPTLPSRFLLRVEALLGELAQDAREARMEGFLARLGRAPDPAPSYPRPMPRPTAEQRKVDIKVTALDRLLGDPYQFYAAEILGLRKLEPLAADPFSDPALRGTLVHDILDGWHRARVSDPALKIVPFATQKFEEAQVHPLFKGLWQPRLLAALERFEQWVDEATQEGREVIATEPSGAMVVDGVKVRGRADRIDRNADGTLAIVDYKTGGPPKTAQVEKGFALQMGLLGLIARDGSFEAGELISGETRDYEYWSLARSKKDGEFGWVDKPMKVDGKRSGLTPDQFLPAHEGFLSKAISSYIVGSEPFTAKEKPDYKGYTDYDQLMRLEEWIVQLSEPDGEGDQ